MRIQRLASRLLSIAMAAVAFGLSANETLAQSTALPPPVTRSVDSNGVDLLSGNFIYPAPSISTAGISETPVSYTGIFVDNWTGVLNSSSEANGSYLTV